MAQWLRKYPSNWAAKLETTTSPKRRAKILDAMRKRVRRELEIEFQQGKKVMMDALNELDGALGKLS